MNTKRIISMVLALGMIGMCLPMSALAAEADVTFTFSDEGISASGEGGYSISGTALTIEEPGTYVLTGSCADGSVKVASGVTSVTLVLDNLQLTSATTAPITCNKETQVVIEAVGSSTLTDAEANDETAVIKAKSGSTLTLAGSGTLSIAGNSKNGIKGAAGTGIIVSELNLDIDAPNNALASDGSLTINSGTLNLSSGNDAIKSEPDEGDTVSEGKITINGGNISVTSAGDGIQATGLLLITGGTLNFTTGGGYQATLGEDDSAKGIKSGSEVQITGGSFNINSADDGIHANGNVTIAGGEYTIYSGDDAIHADYIVTIGEAGGAGPDITIAASVEGIEGAEIYFNAGKGSITASDDGINAANSDLSGYAFKMVFNGGYWRVNAEGGDGLDSNGDIHLNGGIVESFGSSSSNAETALDYDGTCYYNGGTLIAIGYAGQSSSAKSGVSLSFGVAGMGGMGGGQGGDRPQTGEGFDPDNLPEGFDPNNRPEGGQGGQRPEGFNPGQGGMDNANALDIAAGDSIEIKDASGNVLYSITTIKAANSVKFGHASLVAGQTYYLYINGEEVASAEGNNDAGTGMTNPPTNNGDNTGTDTGTGTGTGDATDGGSNENTTLSGWQKGADGNWKYYDADGNPLTGWQRLNWNGKAYWYYFDADGNMKTGWVKDSGKWYYLSTNGSMQTGWLKAGGHWYYLKANGEMTTGWVKDGSKWYYLSANGAMKTGWHKDGSRWYYLKAGGEMAIGWQKITTNGTTAWYYFQSNGSMTTGTATINGKSYSFAAGGNWLG